MLQCTQRFHPRVTWRTNFCLSSGVPAGCSGRCGVMPGGCGRWGNNQPDTESNGFCAEWGLGRVGGGEGEWSMPQGACFSDLRYLNYKFWWGRLSAVFKTVLKFFWNTVELCCGSWKVWHTRTWPRSCCLGFFPLKLNSSVFKYPTCLRKKTHQAHTGLRQTLPCKGSCRSDWTLISGGFLVG